MEKHYELFWEAVKKARNVLVVGHRKPDGDALGSMCAVKIWLSMLGKNVRMACVDKPSKRYGFVPHVDEIGTKIDPSFHDLLIVLDCGASYMTNFPNLLTDKAQVVVNIDHHASNDNFGTINIVEPKSASATLILYKILKDIGAEITPEMATCLLTGIYNDTGSFMHSNTSLEVYEVAADLMKSGAQISQMIRSLFKTNTVSTLKLWGKAFSNAKITKDNFLLSVLKKDDFNNESEVDQLSGAIDYLNMVPNVEFSFLLKEDGEVVKGSLRTRRDDVDLSKIAQMYGGGGHPKASGFVIPGKLERDVHYKIVSDKLQSQPLNL